MAVSICNNSVASFCEECVLRRVFSFHLSAPHIGLMDFREVGVDAGDWIDLARDRDQWWAYVRAVMNLRVP